jgi:chaperonin GroES
LSAKPIARKKAARSDGLQLVSSYYRLKTGDKSMKIRPLHDRVIVKRLEEERKTASGIVIPDAAAEKPDQGLVISVGPGKRDDNGKQITLDVKVGDRVLFGKYSGQTVKVDGEELLVMREEDIMGVVEL